MIEVLGRHTKYAEEKELKKSTTAFEGSRASVLSLTDPQPNGLFDEIGLLIEGDEVYLGLPRQFEIVREFKSQRPASLFSGSDH